MPRNDLRFYAVALVLVSEDLVRVVMTDSEIVSGIQSCLDDCDCDDCRTVAFAAVQDPSVSVTYTASLN